MSPAHRSAMLYAQSVDLHRQGETDRAREAYRKAKAIETSLQRRQCSWCDCQATTTLIDDSPRWLDYACAIHAPLVAHLYDRMEPIA
jgi:hypothetical protein